MTTYATADDVARILRQSADSKVRLSSNALTGISTYESQAPNTRPTPLSGVSIDRSKVTVATSFQGEERLRFVFTSGTEFEVYERDVTQKENLLVGNGTIDSDFVYDDFTFAADTLSGSFSDGNVIDFEFSAHMSIDDLEAYIEEAEIEIDMLYAESMAGRLTEDGSLIFADSVPPQIGLVCQYLAAYYAYTDVYTSKFKDPENHAGAYSNRWKKRAEDLLFRYIKYTRRSNPRVLSFPSFVDKFGFNNIGPEPQQISDDFDTVTRDPGNEDIFDSQ